MQLEIFAISPEWAARVEDAFDAVVARHLEFEPPNFTLAAADRARPEEPLGVIAIQIRALPEPLSGTLEAFINVIEVRPEARRQGAATALVSEAAAAAALLGARQMRGWSTADRAPAIALWQSLGFGLCPAVITPGGQEVRGYYFAKPIG